MSEASECLQGYEGIRPCNTYVCMYVCMYTTGCLKGYVKVVDLAGASVSQVRVVRGTGRERRGEGD